jgi:CRP-like cAMP-binding protein
MRDLNPECDNCPVLKSALFGGFSDEQLSRMSCIFRTAHYRRNQILFFEGGAALHLFAMRSGLVKLVKSLENGKERITRVMFPGEILGLEALAEATYPLTAVALRDSEICAAPRDEFLSFVQGNKDISLGMIRFLVGEVSRVRKLVTDMSFKDARMKVATLLLSLDPPKSGDSPGDRSLTLPFSRQEISEILELSPETVSRALTAFRRERLIDMRGRHLIVQDIAGLEAAARR